MPFTYQRTVHFPDTDAAGVVYFANYLSMCHEAYEEALGAAGINLKTFFADNRVIVPISKSNADFLRPLHCGDKLRITAKPVPQEADSFAVEYEMFRTGPVDKLAASVRTFHVCIRADTRERTPLPAALAAWVNAV